MAEIRLTCEVAAPIELCFDLARDIDLHVESTASTQERALAGRTSGLIELGEEVTWRGRHFGIVLHHTSRITAYERPTRFQDVMTRGAFASFAHDHLFEVLDNGSTRVTDLLKFRSPLGPIGQLVDRWILRRHLENLLFTRSQLLKRVAEERAAALPQSPTPAVAPSRPRPQ